MLDSTNNDVVMRVREFAKLREGQDSPYGWRRYLVDSDAYMRFVCHELIVSLMDEEITAHHRAGDRRTQVAADDFQNGRRQRGRSQKCVP